MVGVKGAVVLVAWAKIGRKAENPMEDVGMAAGEVWPRKLWQIWIWGKATCLL